MIKVELTSEHIASNPRGKGSLWGRFGRGHVREIDARKRFHTTDTALNLENIMSIDFFVKLFFIFLLEFALPYAG